MTNTQVQAWLDAGERGRNRKWLAAQLGVSHKTVEGWLSTGRPIPAPIQKLIARLMAPEDVFVVEFAPEIVEMIKRAAAFRRMEWREWCLSVNSAAAEKLLAAAQRDPASEVPARTARPAPRKRTRPATAAR